jgi:autotransporter-associated beta strand protein
MKAQRTQNQRNQTIPRAEIKHHGFFATALGALLLIVAIAAPALAVDATWNLTPNSNIWNENNNWSPPMAPVNAGDTATFSASLVTSLLLSGDVTIDSMTFVIIPARVGARHYPYNPLTNPNGTVPSSNFTIATAGSSFSFVGFGISNQIAGSTQTIQNDDGGVTNFLNSSTAGNATIINTNSGSGAGVTNFRGTSNAGDAIITNNGGEFVGELGGSTTFQEGSNAANAMITNNGGTDTDALGGSTTFQGNSNAANATIINNPGGTPEPSPGGSPPGGGSTTFQNTSNAANATITNNGGIGTDALGGSTTFQNSSNAANAMITNNGTAFNASVGSTTFQDTSNAADATITNNGGAFSGGSTTFQDTSNAANATITNSGTNGGAGGSTAFQNTSNAGNATITNDGAINFGSGGSTTFQNTSNAADATITNNGGVQGAIVNPDGQFLGGSTTFQDTSNAANATITNNGGTGGTGFFTPGGSTTFQNSSNAANATITNNGGTDTNASGGSTTFQDTSNAGNATLIANGGSGGGFGGTIFFEGDSIGGTARVEVFGNGSLDIRFHNAPGVTIGSIEGDGNVFLGTNNLTVGSNNLSTIFSGVIQDDDKVGGGSLTKVGTGTLTLTGANTYTGATSISTGILNIQNPTVLGTTAAGTTVSSGATLQLQGGITVGTEALTISGTGATGGTGALENVSGTNNYGGLLTLGAASTISSDAGTLNLTNTGTITGAGFGLTLTGAGIGTISSIIGTGTGTLTKNGAGTWTLSGTSANTYTGLTTINAGELDLNKTAGVNAIASNITIGDGSGTDTLKLLAANQISDTSVVTLTNAGSAVFNLNGSNETIGALTDSTAGASGASVQLGAGTLTFGDSTNHTFAGIISGTGGSVIKQGTGTQTLSGDNTYTGPTTVDAGALLVDGSLAAASAVTVNSGATLGGTGTAAGAVTIADGGILAPGHSPGTLTVGSLSLGNASLLNYDLRTPGVIGSGVNDLTIVNGNLTLDGILNTTALAGFGPGAYPLISYGGALTDNTLNIGTVPAGFMASNFTIITGLPNEVVLLVLAGLRPPLVQLWDGPNRVPNVTEGGSGNWDNFTTNWTNASGNNNSSWRNGVAVFAATAGTVTVTQPIFFAGLEFMTDGYQIDQGVRGSLNLIGSPTIRTESGVTATINATLAGAGGISKEGVGTLILNGANTYLGTTAIDAGRLIVACSIDSGQTFVNAGGLLGGGPAIAEAGRGIIGGDLTNSGVVSPGHSPGSLGTLTVNGNYTQNASGTLRIEVAGTAPGQFDLLAVGGHASLAGTLQLIRLGNFQLQVGDKLTFLTAQGGVSGTFSTIQNPFVSNTLIKAEINILGNAVQLEGTQGSFTSVACNPNTVAVGGALKSAVGDPGASRLIGFLDTQPLSKLCGDLELISPEELPAVFNVSVSLANIQSINLGRRMEDIRASPERSSGFSSAGLNINGSLPNFSGGLAGPTGPEGKSGPPVMQPRPDNRWGVWVTGLGEFTDVDSTSNVPGFDLTTGGMTFGADYRVCPNFAVGLTGGYAHTNADLVNNGSLDVNGGTIGAYATAFGSGFYINAAATGTFNGYDEHRTALLGTASGDTNGSDFTGLIAAGYEWKKGGLTIGPTASYQYTYVEVDGFTESGSLAPLTFPDQNADSNRTALGAKVSYDWHVGHVVVKPEVRAAWQHEFGDTEYSIVSRFASGAGNSFTVNGPAIGRDSLLIGAGAAVLLNDRVSVYAYYDGELARTNYSSNNVSAGLRVSF